MVVGADHGREPGVEVEAGVLERLKEPGHHAPEEGHERNGEVRTGQPVLRGGVNRFRIGRDHGRPSTITFPHIVWCAIPQYS